jgi:hypothetical protein
MLFSERSLWTMMHGIVLGGSALLMIGAALFFMLVSRASNGGVATRDASRPLAWLLTVNAAVLWLTVLSGTYVTFPPYRATPPEGLTDLAAYPRSQILASPDTAWLHSFAMESKEHMPWIASMLATAVAFVAFHYGSRLLSDVRLRRMAATLLGICFALVSFVTLMGTFVNKVAPLE